MSNLGSRPLPMPSNTKKSNSRNRAVKIKHQDTCSTQNQGIGILSKMQEFCLPEKARTTNVNVAGNRKGWSTEIDRRSSPT